MADLFTPLTESQIRDLMLGSVKNTRPVVRTQPGSARYDDYAAIAAAQVESQDQIQAVARNVTPATADETGLAQWAVVTTTPRKAGTAARKAQCLRVTGTPAVLIPEGTAWNHSTGEQYQSTADATIAAGGSVLLDLEALVPGSNSRLAIGETLSLDIGIGGVDSDAVLVLALDEGGTDEESIGQWRARVVRVWRDKRQGGARSDYEIWSSEVSWVDRVFVYPRKPAINSVGIVALKAGTGSAQIPTTLQRDELLAYLAVRKPETDDITWLTVVLTALHCEVTVVLAPGTSADFSQSGSPGLTLASYDSGTQTVTTNESLPSDFQAGDLFTLVSPGLATGADGRSTRVTAVTGATTFVVTAAPGESAPFGYTPSASDQIWASSSLLQTIRREILTGQLLCADGRLPGLLDLGPANPDRFYGPWNADAYEGAVSALVANRSTVASAVTAIEGSVSGVLEAVEYAFPSETSVQLLDPRQVWVHV